MFILYNLIGKTIYIHNKSIEPTAGSSRKSYSPAISNRQSSSQPQKIFSPIDSNKETEITHSNQNSHDCSELNSPPVYPFQSCSKVRKTNLFVKQKIYYTEEEKEEKHEELKQQRKSEILKRKKDSKLS